MADTKKKTYGQIIKENREKNHTLDDNIREYGREIGKDLYKEIKLVIEDAKKDSEYRNKDFYIQLLVKKELFGTVRNYVVARLSCPSPGLRQGVFKYHNSGDRLEFLWMLPEPERYYNILNNKQYYLSHSDPAYVNLARTSILHANNLLEQWVIKENGNKHDAVITNKENECPTN